MAQQQKIDWSSLWKKEDWWALWLGFFVFLLAWFLLLGLLHERNRYGQHH
ncbi:hypothetical protein Pogu_0989 [Pyrobaculum oguniense TE7]|uniref:Uncharacterized protein n=1 Tax=Pyrobaculum oguniense (strain DSM 13380 / JCM 10595 / TE7) TaxID=698757 RepID=H6Q9V8_PYROT|nr:hypothetical protein Pogu_0989 [Pyrobaculum oguniense TE7]